MFFPIFIPFKIKTNKDYYYESLTTEEKKEYLNHEYAIERQLWEDSWNGTLYHKYLEKSIHERVANRNEELANRYELLSNLWFWITTIYRTLLSGILICSPLVISFYFVFHWDFALIWFTFGLIAFLATTELIAIRMVDRIWYPKHKK